MALARYDLLRPCVEGGISLTEVARTQCLPRRTVQRWLAQYRPAGHSDYSLPHPRRRARFIDPRRCAGGADRDDHGDPKRGRAACIRGTGSSEARCMVFSA